MMMTKLLDTIADRLCTEARHWWKLSSVQLAMVAGAVTAWAASDPASFTRAVDLLPEWARPFVGITLAVLAIGTRLAKQPKLGGTDGDQG